MKAHDIYKISSTEIVDYSFLMTILREYRSPRSKITELIKGGDLIRVKKGLYVLAEKGKPYFYSKEILANLIYGPSYISTYYALAYYQLIPERVETVTSITSIKKNKKFNTPLGQFVYDYQNPKIYSCDFTRIDQKNSGFLIATPEKALADLLFYLRPESKNQKELKEYLLVDIRLDWSSFKKFSLTHIKKIAAVMKVASVFQLYELLKEEN